MLVHHDICQFHPSIEKNRPGNTLQFIIFYCRTAETDQEQRSVAPKALSLPCSSRGVLPGDQHDPMSFAPVSSQINHYSCHSHTTAPLEPQLPRTASSSIPRSEGSLPAFLPVTVRPPGFPKGMSRTLISLQIALQIFGNRPRPFGRGGHRLLMPHVGVAVDTE